MREIQIGRVYRHFKGDYYLVEAVARDSETEQPVVIYRRLYADGGLWVRPLPMFLSRVDREKYPDVQQEYRFELQEIASVAGQLMPGFFRKGSKNEGFCDTIWKKTPLEETYAGAVFGSV